MRKDFLLLAALLCILVQGTWAASSFGGGDGSVKTPYIISSTDDWDQLSADVAAGTDYDGQYFRLDADITVTTMLGTGSTYKNAKPFKGVFDGSGHTLTFNHTSLASEGDIAPFRFVENATIKNLHVDGTIHMGSKFAAGIAGHATGTNTIADCRVSTSIICHNISDGTHGGLVANIQGGTTTIQRCAFDGSFVGANDKNNLVELATPWMTSQ